jgi:PAS domain-containing protein
LPQSPDNLDPTPFARGKRKENAMLDQTILKVRQGLPSGPLTLNSELRFRGLLEKLPAGAYTCDPNGLITYYNQLK